MAVHVVCTFSKESDPRYAMREIADQVQKNGRGLPVKAGLMYCTIDMDPKLIVDSLQEVFPGVPVAGASSCLGVSTSSCPELSMRQSVCALWFLSDEDVSFGSALFDKDRLDTVATGKALASAALKSVGVTVDRLRHAFLHSTPGHEEQILQGIYSVVDRNVDLVGGTAADNDLSGKWFVWNEQRVSRNGCALILSDWNYKIAAAYRSGYLVSDKSATVTSANHRILFELDDLPAAELYNMWIQSKLQEELAHGGTILTKTTFSPLGVPRAKILGMDGHILIHPERILLPKKALSLFAEVKEGEQVVLMHSNEISLVNRGARVATEAMVRGHIVRSEISAALMIYCAGCMLAIQPRVKEMISELKKVIGDVPFVVTYTFGEQGCILPHQIDHGNLMLSVLLFSTTSVSN